MKAKIIISKLKSYHIIFFGCILGILLVLHSNDVNEQKLKMKQNKEQIAFFDKIISKRKLQELNPGNAQQEENDDEVIITDEVCSHASDELKEYYKTNVLSKIDLDNGPIKCEDKDKDYMKALIALVQKLVEGDNNQNENDGDAPINDDGGRRRNLRNLLDKETEENIKTYGSRILPPLVFFAFSILSFLGWIICCFCNCCNCCCCCCCKKPGCKIPFFVFTYIFYALVVAVCIYGLTQTKKIFTGLSNTECSFLKFFDEILFGEEKEARPKWVGIEGVSNILNNLHDQITDMKDAHLEDELDINMDEIDVEKNSFMHSLKTAHLDFYKDNDPTTPKDGYCKEYQSTDSKYVKHEGNMVNLQGKYCIDLLALYGKYDDTKEEEEKFTGFNRVWYEEISITERETTSSLETARDSFSEILGEKLNEIESGINSGIDKLEKLRKPFNSVYNEISDSIYDISEMAYYKGELIVKLVFGALAFLNIALAVLLLLICMCSGQTCTSCCCCRCLCKFFTHLIWNILALLMIISFLVGATLSLVGRIGGDMMSFVSYVLSEENFNKNDNAVLLWKLGDGKDILEECIVGNGNLSSVFDLSDITTNFDTIRRTKNDIQGYKQTFNSLATNYTSYHYLRSILEDKTKFKEDTRFINQNDISNAMSAFSLNNIIDLLNEEIGTSNNEKYNKETGDKNFVCTDSNRGSGPSSSTSPQNNLLHPWTCEPIYRGWIKDSTNTGIKNYAEIASDAITILKYANNTKTPDDPDYISYYDVLNRLKNEYSDYLQTFIDVLNFFDVITGNIIDIIEDGIGNSNDTFSFLNGKFIKTDLKIVLKYLKYSLGQDIYTVGICLVIVGFSLILSISSTILLIVIINIDLENNKKLSQDTEVPKFPVTNEGKVIQFKY